jgi:hypothetical protein
LDVKVLGFLLCFLAYRYAPPRAKRLGGRNGKWSPTDKHVEFYYRINSKNSTYASRNAPFRRLGGVAINTYRTVVTEYAPSLRKGTSLLA